MTSADSAALVTHRGGCHCGAVAFEVDAPAASDARLRELSAAS